MNQYVIFGIGFLSQILFSARLLVQWITSEKAGRIVSPLLFWQISLVASFLMMVYGILRNDFAILLGQFITYAVYIRNLYYHGFWDKIPKPIRVLAVIFPIVAIGWIIGGDNNNIQTIISNKNVSSHLMIWGVASQLVFTFRFVYQWIYTEKRKESILPIGFWLISFVGSMLVLSYAIIRKDPVLFIGQIFGFVVYTRNIILWMNDKKKSERMDGTK
jgi:lipid-A-disaccharide synthase-like uncharacterized protein